MAEKARGRGHRKYIAFLDLKKLMNALIKKAYGRYGKCMGVGGKLVN